MPDGSVAHAQVRPLDAPFGAEVIGLDARSLGSAKGILDLLHRHQVIVLRDQVFAPAEYVRFSSLLGELQLQVLDRFTHPQAREIYVLSNVIENGEPVGNSNDGFTWHTDQSTRREPTAYTMLYGVECPPVGGDTLFANTALSFEGLPAERQQKLSGLRAIFNHARLHEKQREMLANDQIRDDHKPLSADERKALEDQSAVHPLVRTHPATGRKGLYLGTLSFAGFEGVDTEEALRLMDELVTHSTGAPFLYRHQWRENDLVLWDNRALLHIATAYDKEKYRRLMWRTSVAGEVPF
jgi:taurine dioxygenase